MAVNTVDSIAKFMTNGLITHYSVHFRLFANEDLLITCIDPAGASITLILGAHYKVNGVGDGQGGSVVTTTALAENHRIGGGKYPVGTEDAATKKNCNASASLAASVVPTGGVLPVTLADTVQTPFTQWPTGPRPVLRYGSATTVHVSNNFVIMGEFRFMGGYTGGRARVLPMSTKVASIAPAGLGAESVVKAENWYAAFAVSNATSSTAAIKTMPFLRVSSVVGLVVNLNKAGEGIHTVQSQTYAWSATNNLTGVKCLVISEAGIFSGRVATITANAPDSITLDSVGALAFGDYLLPAPPGFAEFCYLATFYYDTLEVRNIYDTGIEVVSKGIYILSPDTVGAQNNTTINCAGYISPLASGVRLDSLCRMSTASGGDYAEYFSPDSGNHIVRSNYDYKDNSSSRSFVFGGVSLAFLYAQTFCITTAGTLQGSRSNGQLTPTGWFEP